MSMGMLDDHEGPWTEAEYLALGEMRERIEFLDGSLLVTSANDYHNDIMANLGNSLRPTARAAGLRVTLVPNIRLDSNGILIPDLAVKNSPISTAISGADEVVLVCEITSPSNAASDRIKKMLAYAKAQIPWYLLVEPDFIDYKSVTLRLFRLDGNAYIVHTAAREGGALVSQVPFPLSIRTDELLAF
jgi:Uma2 family endonuclease